MTEISANIRLRPTRIGFLVRPTDLASVRKIMRYCACVWGGVYNPIIPVFRSPPKEWTPEPFDRVRGLAVARGYIRFFEPDVYVEAQEGLSKDAGLDALREQHGLHPSVVPLSEFLKPRDDRDWSEPLYGLSIHDLLEHVYDSEARFQARDVRESIFVKADRANVLVESVFGFYPAQADAAYFAQAYKDVFKPTELSASPDTWLRVFRDGAEIPLGVTARELDKQRYWHHELLFFVFDPARPTDLIDLWNLRLEPRPIMPVPVNWFGALAEFMSSVLEAEHRPIRGNPQG